MRNFSEFLLLADIQFTENRFNCNLEISIQLCFYLQYDKDFLFFTLFANASRQCYNNIYAYFCFRNIPFLKKRIS